MTASGLCELWGLRIIGSTLKTAGVKPRGLGELGVDEAGAAVQYVESTPGFHIARPALLHRFGYGLPSSALHWRGPGELRTHALLRLEWYAYSDQPDEEIPGLVVCQFIEDLEDRMMREPFRVQTPPRIVIDDKGRIHVGDMAPSLRRRYYRPRQ